MGDSPRAEAADFGGTRRRGAEEEFFRSTDLDCEGAVIVAFSNIDDRSEYGDTDGRCDVFVEAGRSQILAVPLSDRYRRSYETAEAHLIITADAGLTLQRLPPTEVDNYQFLTDLEITLTARC